MSLHSQLHFRVKLIPASVFLFGTSIAINLSRNTRDSVACSMIKNCLATDMCGLFQTAYYFALLSADWPSDGAQCHFLLIYPRALWCDKNWENH